MESIRDDVGEKIRGLSGNLLREFSNNSAELLVEEIRGKIFKTGPFVFSIFTLHRLAGKTIVEIPLKDFYFKSCFRSIFLLRF